jgi:hypothetical protein
VGFRNGGGDNLVEEKEVMDRQVQPRFEAAMRLIGDSRSKCTPNVVGHSYSEPCLLHILRCSTLSVHARLH